jgi:ParB/RepB/Spo0J family partition protein
MQLEFHQLDRRWEHLRVRHPARQRRLLASLAEAGQQTPIIVVAAEGQPDRYLVIDGYQRITALRQLGRDTVEGVVWPLSEAEALLLDRSLRWSEHETALEQGWLLAEMEQRFGYGLEELARRFDRSVSWVSRRLALVELLPEAIRQRLLDEPGLFFKTQRQTEPKASTAPGAELLRDLEMVAAIVNRATRRLAGATAERNPSQLEDVRRQIERIQNQLRRMDGRIQQEQAPHVEPSATHHDSGTEHAGSEQTRDRADVGNLPPECPQSSSLELQRGSGDPAGRESRTLPLPDPGTFERLQGESRPGP